jgi:hypothetical protein
MHQRKYSLKWVNEKQCIRNSDRYPCVDEGEHRMKNTLKPAVLLAIALIAVLGCTKKIKQQ